MVSWIFFCKIDENSFILVQDERLTSGSGMFWIRVQRSMRTLPPNASRPASTGFPSTTPPQRALYVLKTTLSLRLCVRFHIRLYVDLYTRLRSFIHFHKCVYTVHAYITHLYVHIFIRLYINSCVYVRSYVRLYKCSHVYL